MPEKKIVAVYGTLRKGGDLNSKYMERYRSTFLKTGVLKGYSLYDMNGIPGIEEGSAEDKVVVDVFRVGPKGLAALDQLEGAYERKAVTLEDGTEVEAYVWNRPRPENYLQIVDGDWMEYLKVRTPVPAARARAPEPEDEEDSEEDLSGPKHEILDSLETIADEINSLKQNLASLWFPDSTE
jgi:gamma-glutamylcyclotransferase (GGCT)/AIG2-like uncharacterized protein YtfP